MGGRGDVTLGPHFVYLMKMPHLFPSWHCDTSFRSSFLLRCKIHTKIIKYKPANELKVGTSQLKMSLIAVVFFFCLEGEGVVGGELGLADGFSLPTRKALTQ